MVSRPPRRFGLFPEQRSESMKSFDWQNLLRSHPIFASLGEQEIMRLVSDEVSHERVSPPDTVILREGEAGDSIFLIGSGSVQVTLRGTGGPLMRCPSLKAGEILGGMAGWGGKPRQGTVVAREECVRLEVAGGESRKLRAAPLGVKVKIYPIGRAPCGNGFKAWGSA